LTRVTRARRAALFLLCAALAVACLPFIGCGGRGGGEISLGPDGVTRGFGGRPNRRNNRVSLAAFTPADGDLHARIDANDSLYTDAPPTALATADNADILSLKCAVTGKVFNRFRTASLTGRLKVSGNRKWLRTVTTNPTTISGGVMYEHTDDTDFNPGNNTFYGVVFLDRNKLTLAEIVADVGNSLSASLHQLAISTSSYFATFNGSFSAAPTPFMTLGSVPVVFCVRSSNDGVDMFRADVVDLSGVIIKHELSRTITSNATATGWSIAGRANHNLFAQGDYPFLEMWNGKHTDSEVRTRLGHIQAYMLEQGWNVFPSGSQDILVVNGDSQGAGIACDSRAGELGALIKAGLTATYPSLEYYNLSAASRQVTGLDTLAETEYNYFRATTGRCVYVMVCGTNDATVVTPATLYNRIYELMLDIKFVCPWVITVYIEYTPRGDGAVPAYEDNRATFAGLVDADPTFLGTVDYVFRTSQDSVLGDAAVWSAPNATYVHTDEIHMKNAAYTRMYSGSDADQTVQDIAALAFAAAPLNHGENGGVLRSVANLTGGFDRLSGGL
jgi:hypothetical protein